MNKLHRESAMKYYEKRTDLEKPLIFKDAKVFILSDELKIEYDKLIDPIRVKRLTLKGMIRRIISISAIYPTILKSDENKAGSRNYQCRAGARRTAPDILRIINGYRPDNPYDIFKVMHALYQMTKSENSLMVTSYCSTIRQRTFRFEELGHIYSEGEYDEFGIRFKDWENI